MSSVTPKTTLPANGVTSGAVQITGTGCRVSARTTAGNCTLVLLRMDTVSGNWFRYTDLEGNEVQLTLEVAGVNDGSEDYSFTLPAAAANEYYTLLIQGGGTFTGVAEIENCSAPSAAGGNVPSSRVLTPIGGVTIDSATAAVDLSADRTIGLGGTADMVLSTGSLGWVGAAGKAGSLVAGSAAALTITANAASTWKVGTAGALSLDGFGGINFKVNTTTVADIGVSSSTKLTMAANKDIACAAGTTAVDLSLGTGTFKPPTGIFTFQGKQAATATANRITDPGTGAAIPVTSSGTVAITTAAAETNTLAIPTFLGQWLLLFVDTYAVGDRVVTSAQSINQAGNTILTFGAARDMIKLEAITVGGALRWSVTANDGVALS